jgi:hypothetical protein
MACLALPCACLLSAGADQLAIGDTAIRNVAFLVQPDERFTDTPEDRRGVIGLPVILALRTVRWIKGEALEFGFPSEPRNIYKSNLCLDSAFPVVTVASGQSKLSFSFDTGATLTGLYARFGREFPRLVEAGRKDSAQKAGAGGTVRDDVDPLRQARAVTIDFGAMRLTLSR